MPDTVEYGYRVKRFFYFTGKEIRDIVISIIVISFIWGYNERIRGFDFGSWFANFIAVVIIVAMAFIVNISAYKIVALFHGYMAEYSAWLIGLSLGVIVTLVTQGFFPLILPGGIVLVHLSRLRIGYFRFGLNIWQSSQVALAGPFSNVFLVMFVKTMQWIFGVDSKWLDSLFIFNLVFAVYMMLPIPPLPGIIAFFGSKLTYVFALALLLSYILLIILFNYYSLIVGFILGLIVYFVYFWTAERG
jgi:hypothetical protein